MPSPDPKTENPPSRGLLRRSVPNIAIVGATGAVGETLRHLIEERHLAVGEIALLASARSAGRHLAVAGRDIAVADLEEFDFSDTDIAFFSAGSSVSHRHARRAAEQGAMVIDNTNAFRMEADVPLVVPQVNAHAIADARTSRLIANPNCSIIPLVRLLRPLHEAFGIRRVMVSTYQAASGAGLGGIEELRDGARAHLAGEAQESRRFPRPLAFNLIPSIDIPMPTGFTLEEQKMVQESRKILERPDLRLTATCVRVPVVNGHSEAVQIDCERPVDRERMVELLSTAPEIRVFDEGPGSVAYPTPIEMENGDLVHVGRIRTDPDDDRSALFWLIADNLKIGAALNAIQIAEHLIEGQRA